MKLSATTTLWCLSSACALAGTISFCTSHMDRSVDTLQDFHAQANDS